jgi:hypothetical protein
VGALAVLVILAVVPHAFAKSACQSGFGHGMSDAKLLQADDNAKTYVDGPGKGLPHHTQEFKDGYAKGWCSVMGSNSGTETDNADFECEKVLSH